MVLSIFFCLINVSDSHLPNPKGGQCEVKEKESGIFYSSYPCLLKFYYELSARVLRKTKGGTVIYTGKDKGGRI